MTQESSAPAVDAQCPGCGALVCLSAGVFAQLRGLVAESLGIDRDEITAETAVLSEERDSLEMVELVMEIEDEFDVSVPNDFAQRIQTVGDAVRHIERMRRKRPG